MHIYFQIDFSKFHLRFLFSMSIFIIFFININIFIKLYHLYYHMTINIKVSTIKNVFSNDLGSVSISFNT